MTNSIPPQDRYVKPVSPPSSGIPALNQAVKDGWQVEFSTPPVPLPGGVLLPMGGTPQMIADKRDVLAQNLMRADAKGFTAARDEILPLYRLHRGRGLPRCGAPASRRAVTAIAAVNDLAALGAMSAIADAGLRVPGDIAITGYDDIFVSAIRQVSLTSVNSDRSGIGSLAAQCVLRRTADSQRLGQEHLLPPRLVIRYSSGGRVDPTVPNRKTACVPTWNPSPQTTSPER